MVEEAAKRLGRLDILVNNAGTNIRKPPEEYSVEEWKLILDTNLTSAFVASQAAYPHMKRAGGGKIVNIGSMMSIFGASFVAPYGASKGGIVQLTRALACAWAKDNIQVNAVLPGWIDTALTRRARADIKGLHERVLARTPAGRWGEPEDLSGIAVFLCSRASDFVTGTAIPGRRRLFLAGLERGLDEGVDVVRAAVHAVEEPRRAEDAGAVRHAEAHERLAQLPHAEEVPHAQVDGRVEVEKELRRCRGRAPPGRAAP